MSIDNKAYLKVVQYIRSQLEMKCLNVGDRLPTERELSENLDVSRNSIREALKTMESMGIIESQQGSGNYLTENFEKGFITSLSMMALLKQINYLEVSQLRRGIETQSLLLAIDRIQNDELMQLEKILFDIEKANDKNAGLDKEFHFLIVSASGNKLMMSIMQALSATFEDAINHVLLQISKKDELMLWGLHRQIYESLLYKNKKMGADAIQLHYDIIDKVLQTSD